MPRGCYWPRGKMLGGSHGINAMLYLRGNHRDYDNWEAMGNPGWGFEDVLPFFKKTEGNVNTFLLDEKDGERFHSTDGELKVSYMPSTDPLKDVILAAAKELEFDMVDDFNKDVYIGYGNVQGTIYQGVRQSTAKAFLAANKERENLKVIKYAHVNKILINGKGVVEGVDFVYNNTQQVTVKVKKEVVVSAGAVGTPQILLLSGIGPKKHLEKKKIELKKALPVGKNLQDHAITPLIFQFQKSEAVEEDLKQLLDSLFTFATQRYGSLTHPNTVDLVGYASTTNDTTFPDIETHHFTFRKNSPTLKFYMNTVGYDESIIKSVMDANLEGHIMFITVVLLNPKSAGDIKLKSNNPSDRPKIRPNFFAEEEDIQTMLRGIKFQTSFVETKSFKDNEGELVLPELTACKDLEKESEEYWRCYIKQMSSHIYHPVGTAKMGPAKDKTSVVDPELRVHGIKGLRVADASIMPNIVSANTNAPTIMIGEKAADFITTEWMKKEKHDEL